MPYSNLNSKQALLKVEWRSRYSVGIPVIDEQHKELFELTNTLISYYEKHDDFEIFNTFLNFLLDYTVEHFSTEEKYLSEMGSDALNSQCEEHEIFKEQVMKAVNKELEQDTSYRRSLILFLQNWIKNHIINSDVPAFKKANYFQ